MKNNDQKKSIKLDLYLDQNQISFVWYSAISVGSFSNQLENNQRQQHTVHDAEGNDLAEKGDK